MADPSSLTLNYDFTDPQFDGVQTITAQTGADLTVTRASDATVMDYFNVLKTVNDNEPRFTGGRRVENRCLQSQDLTTTWLEAGLVGVDASETDPDGGSAADRLDVTAGGTIHISYQNRPALTGIARTFSCYMKDDGAGFGSLTVNRGSTDYYTVVADLTAGTITDTASAGPTATLNASGIEDAGNGWWRVWSSGVLTNATQYHLIGVSESGTPAYTAQGYPDYSATAGKDILVYGAQIEDVTGQDDPAPSEYIATTTAAKAQWYATKRRTNLLLQSNDLSTSWINARTTDSQAVAGETNPLTGAADVNSINEDGSAANNHYIYQNFVLPSNDTYTFSVYAKASNRSWIQLRAYNYSLGDVGTFFNVTDGAGAVGTTAAQIDSAAIEDAGGGWYRCSITFTEPGADLTGWLMIYAAEADNDVTYDGLTQESVLTYGAQIERGSTATAYIATTDAVASSDFDTAITPTGLLIEEARTNIATYSEDFSSWTAAGNALAVVGNEVTAPDGTLTADLLIDDSSTSTGNVYVRSNLGTTVSTAYTYSMYVKAGQLSWCNLTVALMGALVVNQYYDLSGNGAVGASPGADVTDSGIESVGGGWYRCWLSYTTDSVDTVGQYRVYPADADGDITVDLDGTSSIYIWGAQLEAGSFPTSYIPTTTASVTRAADVVSTTDVSWYNTDGAGSVYNNFSRPASAGSAYIMTISDNSVSDRVMFYQFSNDVYGYMNSASVGAFDAASPGAEFSINTSVETSFGYATNDMQAYTNGTAWTPDTVGDVPVGISRLHIGSTYAGASQLNGHIARIVYYNERLADSVLEDLSNGTFPVAASVAGTSSRTGPGLGFGLLGKMGA